MTRICLLAALLLTGCAGAPPPRGDNPCSRGENSIDGQAYRYANAGM